MTIMTVQEMNFFLVDSSQHIVVRNVLSWIVIVATSINILVHLVLMVEQSIKKLYSTRKRKIPESWNNGKETL